MIFNIINVHTPNTNELAEWLTDCMHACLPNNATKEKDKRFWLVSLSRRLTSKGKKMKTKKKKEKRKKLNEGGNKNVTNRTVVVAAPLLKIKINQIFNDFDCLTILESN